MDRFDFSAYFFSDCIDILWATGCWWERKGQRRPLPSSVLLFSFFSLFFSHGHASACTSEAQGQRAWTRAVSCQRPGYVMNVFQS